MTTNGFIQFLQRISDPEYHFNSAVNKTRILSMQEDLFIEFASATQEAQPQHLRRIELSDSRLSNKGEIVVSTCELVIPEKLLIGKSGGPLRAKRIVKFADACIRERMALSSGELRLSDLWQSEATSPGEGDSKSKRETAAKDWFFSNFHVSR